MHDDVTRPKGGMVVVVMLKSKMVASSTSSEGNSKSTGSMIYVKAQMNCPAMSAFLLFKFPASGKANAILNKFVRDYNYHNARLSCKSIVLCHYA